MRAWSAPGGAPAPGHGTCGGAATTLRPASLVTTAPDGPARLYVCGITPYDATHIGHAATYVGFDLLNRAWRNAGHEVVFVENVTDVDDPLLERAAKVNVDWTELAERETELFRQDMQALRVLPPDHYVGAVESIPLAVGPDRAAAGGGLGLPGRGRPLLLGDRGPGVRRRSPATTATPCSRSSPSAAATPTGPARRTRSTAWSGAAARDGEPSLGQPARARPSRLAHRVRRDRARAPRRRVRRAGRRQRPGLPAPRDVRRPRAGRRSVGRRSRRSTATPGWWPTTARRCRSRRATWSSSRRCATATSTRWRSGWCCCATTTAPTGSGSTPSSGTPSTPSPTGAGRSRWAPAPRPRRSSPRCWPPWPTTSTPRARWPPCRRWVDATLGSTGHLADTSDADAALTMHALLDAALGLAL